MLNRFFKSLDFYILLVLIASIVIGIFYWESIPKWLLKLFVILWGSTFVGIIAFIIGKIFSKKVTKESSLEFKKIIESTKSTVEFTIDTSKDIYNEIKFKTDVKQIGIFSKNKDFIYYKDLKNIIWKIPTNEKSINFDLNVNINSNEDLSDFNDLFN
jgi:uncharacterized protein YneR